MFYAAMTSEERTSGGDPPVTQEDSTTQKPAPSNEQTKVNSKDSQVKKDTDWINVLFYIYLHLAALYGIGLIFREAHWATTILGKIL